jgi:hypothetical protein
MHSQAQRRMDIIGVPSVRAEPAVSERAASGRGSWEWIGPARTASVAELLARAVTADGRKWPSTRAR